MEAVVFDLDGVVVNTEKYWGQAEEEIYSQTVKSGSVNTHELSGMSIANTYQYLSDNYETSVSPDQFFEMYERRAEDIYMQKASLMPGLKELMAELRQRGLKIGLATGSYWPEYVIKRFDLEFDTVVDSGMVEGDGKPEPETYLTAVERLGVKPEEAVAIDDTNAGISSAKAAGLYCIGYEGSDGQSLSKADETVDGPEELAQRIRELIEAP